MSDVNPSYQELENQNTEFKLLYDSINEGIYSTKGGHLTNVNKAFCELFGYTKDELIGMPAWYLAKTELRDEIRETFIQRLQLRDNSPIETTCIRKNGEIFMAEISVSFLHDTRNFGIVRDISEKIQKENEILKAKELAEENEERLAEAQEISNIGSWEWIFETDTVRWSKKLYEMVGWNLNSPPPQYEELSKIHTEESFIKLNNAVNECIRSGTKYKIELDLIRTDNKIIKILAIGGQLRNKEDKLIGLRGTVQDITDLKQIENELRKSKEIVGRNQLELKRAQEIAHIGSWYLDIETNQVIWTEELYKMYDFDPTQPVPPYTEHMKLFAPESWELLSISLERTRETGIPYELELKTVKKDGSNGWMWVRGESVKDENSKIVGLWGAAQDITDRKKFEEELKLAKEKAENNNRINEARLNLIQFSENHNIDEILEETLNIAEQVSQSRIGFFHFVHEDQITLVLQNWSSKTKQTYCKAEGKGLHYPIDKAGVWVDCVYERKPVIHNNYEALSHKKGMPEGHAPLHRELVIPIIYDEKIKAIFGVGNKESDYNQTDVEEISLLAYLAWEIVEKKRIKEELIKAKENAEESANALKHSHDLMQYIIEHNRGAIAVHDKNFKYLFVSQSYLKDYKIKEKNIIGKHHYEVLPDIPQKWRDVHKKALLGEISNADEDSYPREDGTLEWTRWECRPWYEADKTIGGFIIYTEVITQKKNMELELKAAKEKAEESDRLKTSFLQNMSHEIRTPLNAISGFTGLLNKPELSEEKRKSFVHIIQNSSSQLISIVSDILTISSLETKQEKTNITNVCINEIIIEMLTIFKQQAINQNISLYAKQQLNDKQSEIKTDKTKITQILSNLLANALKFTHEGFIEFGYTLKKDMEAFEMEFYVKDSGIGIKPEYQGKIFERFRQADQSINKLYGGTGLGLAISKAFVELLGGKIRVESEPEKGSIFYFTVPYLPVNQSGVANWPTKQNDNSKTIIVAEDEEYNFLFIEELLIDMDLKLIHTKDGQETVDVFKSNPNIDLILMDIKMPVMSGAEASKIIKSIKPECPIVAQSAYALEHERAKFEGLFDDYITKPISEEELKQKVLKYLNKARD